MPDMGGDGDEKTSHILAPPPQNSGSVLLGSPGTEQEACFLSTRAGSCS